MKATRTNWPIWVGFLLSLIALLSYPFVFVNWPLTRDFPWANLLLFAIAAVLLLIGLRRAFSPERRRLSKLAASVVATLSVLVLGFFVFSFFVASRWLPASHGAPQVGQKAPDYTLSDTNNKQVSLSELLSAPINAETGNAGALSRNEREARTLPKGVLLVFYRGYW
jgi:predicted PurR-regulated permease PerM